MQKIISFILAEVPKLKGGEVLVVPRSESAPHYFSESVPKQTLIAEESHVIDGHSVNYSIKAYHPGILLVEGQLEVENVFSDEAFALREDLIEECHSIIKKYGGKFEASEEYSIAIVTGYGGDPDELVSTYSARIASFLKSEHQSLDEKEIEYTLSSQIKYLKNDLVIVDWDGAFVFDPDGEYESIVELLQIANLELLRYRILDADLGRRLRRAGKVVREYAGDAKFSRNKELAQSFKDLIEIRSRSVAELELIDREIKLIGDWYSARLYDLAAKKMKFDGWKTTIKEKLDSLEDVYSIVAENFSMSRTHYLEFIQIIAFFVLQVGWFALIILEVWFYTSH